MRYFRPTRHGFGVSRARKQCCSRHMRAYRVSVPSALKNAWSCSSSGENVACIASTRSPAGAVGTQVPIGMLFAEGVHAFQRKPFSTAGGGQALLPPHQQCRVDQQHCRHAQYQAHQPVPEQGADDGAGKQHDRSDDGRYHASGRWLRMIDVGKQHVGAVETQCAIAVAGDDDIAVALHDLLADWHTLHAIVAARFATRQHLPGEYGIEGFVGAAVGVGLLGRSLIGPAEAARPPAGHGNGPAGGLRPSTRERSSSCGAPSSMAGA